MFIGLKDEATLLGEAVGIGGGGGVGGSPQTFPI
jgi:hypothetical protein